AVRFAEKIMKFIRAESVRASEALAGERGAFPNYDKSVYARGGRKMRNATTNTVAPTGSISIIAGCSSGIEPLFAVSFIRNVLSGTRLFEVNPIFEEVAQSRGFYSRELIARIAQSGSLQKLRDIPEDVRKIFVTAFDVSPRQHLETQAAFQKHSDNSVSKTINLPREATVEDVRNIYLTAYRLKCKGITVYRSGSKEEQVLSFAGEAERTSDSNPLLVADAEYNGSCPAGACLF
ncbi:MAG TPA: hypothetical protein VLS90_02330, partial [Thermodesulfobacteriota bacterium]|nr:hypothetical protein [Thermodesulfobacteriota bacterium]